MKVPSFYLLLCLFLIPNIAGKTLAVGSIAETTQKVENTSFGDQVKSFFKNTKTQIQDKVRHLKQWLKAKSQAMKDEVKRWRNLWAWGWILGGIILVAGAVLSFVSVGIGSATALAISAGLLILGSLGILAGTVGLIVFLIKNSEQSEK